MTVATHPHPAWRDRANFIIRTSLPEEGHSEQLWARQITPTTFEVCCIPFFAYGVALGDVVQTDADYQLTHVIEPSGRTVLRVWFGEAADQTLGRSVADKLVALGAVIEWSSVNLLAVDATDAVRAAVWRSLERGHSLGELTFEQASPRLG